MVALYLASWLDFVVPQYLYQMQGARDMPRMPQVTPLAGMTPLGIKPSRNSHKGYFIRYLMTEEWAISKDGRHISYAPTFAAALAIIDALVD
jgi:hypothetical protein